MYLHLSSYLKILICSLCMSTFTLSLSYANPLEALLKKAQKQKEARQKAQAQLDLAQVTFLLFINQSRSNKEISELQAQFQQEILQHVESQHAKHFVLNQISRDQMPISIDPFIQHAPQHKEIYTQAPAVISFFYRGPRLPREEHLSALCVATDRIWSRLGHGILANLSTFSGDTPQSFASRCQQFDFGWVRPEAELTKTGEVRMITRGLAQFGQPDLESTPLSKLQAPKVFPTFQQHMRAIHRGESITLGQTFKGKKVLKCQRESHYYDRKCVRLTYP